MQQYDNKKTRWLGNAIASFVLMLLLAMFAALMCGCNRTIYVPPKPSHKR